MGVQKWHIFFTSCCGSIGNGHIWPLLVISNKSISPSVKSFWKFFELRVQFISFNNVVRIVISWTPWKTQNECLWICWFSYQRMSVCYSWADLTHQVILWFWILIGVSLIVISYACTHEPLSNLGFAKLTSICVIMVARVSWVFISERHLQFHVSIEFIANG